MYSETWDKIMNQGKLDLFNTTNFTSDVIFHNSPANVVGIDNARDHYKNYLTGFSNIKFDIKEIFRQGDKLTKHWVFSGKHTGEFFGIPSGFFIFYSTTSRERPEH